MLSKKIVVTPYNPNWPKIFEIEAFKIKTALGDNCLTIHHIGSTSVPGLSAKPIIDMIVLVKNAKTTVKPLENLGFKYKGDYNIPLRFYFSRTEGVRAHLHVYEEDHPEVELNILFTSYLRNHAEAREEYARLKENLLNKKSSYEKNNSIFTGYSLGKYDFIRKILKTVHYSRIRIVRCTQYIEWDFVKKTRQKYLFDPLSMKDPYTWTFTHKDHFHLIFYQGVEIIGYGHIQFWPDLRAALKVFMIEENFRHRGFGSQFLDLCEKWLKSLGIKSLHKEVRPDEMNFYLSHGYLEIPFNDPHKETTKAHDLAMEKNLLEK